MGRGLGRGSTLAAGLAMALISTAARAEEAPPWRASAQGVVDVWRNARGGLGAGSASVEEVEVRLDVDSQAALGWPGLSASVSAIGVDSGSPSARLAGDLQNLDNKDATSGVRIYEAWLRQQLAAGYAKAGVIDLNSEFNVAETSALFVNGAQGLGLDLGQVGPHGPSVFPAPRLAAVLALEGPATIKLGVFDGLSQASGPRRRDGLADAHGLLGIAEVSHLAQSGARITLGAWRRSSNFGSTLPVLRKGPASGAYLLAETRIWTGPARSLDGLFRLGIADPKAERVGAHITADVVLNNPFLQRSGEALGIGVVSALRGEHAQRADATAGLASYRAETTVEVTYKAPLASSVSLQPDLQYVVHPGAVRGRRNALVVGIRLAFGAAVAP